MLLQSFRKEITRPECNPSFQSLHCLAHLDQDIGPVLPYLNTELGGFDYRREPPSLTLRTQGKIITLHPRLIAINALKDQAEADKILSWLQGEINRVWQERDHIQPSHTVRPRPQVFEILKLLPKSNCRKCGQPTCMVFATQVAEGGRGVDDCPEIGEPQAGRLRRYLSQFFKD